ncbi:adenine-specific methyltransferase EcoRI family protein [uncultured Corynebacterium sp.]|uniref:adenine-specific methyltransferase EcoRI family protein n=1 Tax=uncultured Corynebacterium sp. TaxID=159447 RepID=UPI00262B6167|nr:adenine-specific methyltransferase EcoRI family protein [uncultured Corynebacterium sp.]
MTNPEDLRAWRSARLARNDDLLTQETDIEKELRHYTSVFEEKVVYCNAESSKESSFVRYFQNHFHQLRLKKLIATGPSNYRRQGSLYIYDGDNGSEWKLTKNGDFRSDECLEFLYQSDIVVTHPPYSLAHDYLNYMEIFRKNFLFISHIDSIKRKDVFKLFQNDQLWLGYNSDHDFSGFVLPEKIKVLKTYPGYNQKGNRIITPESFIWLTNIDHFKRHQPIPLTKTWAHNKSLYPRYDNLNALDIPNTDNIPSDYTGLMGVPVTFLADYSPEQFHLVDYNTGHDGEPLSLNEELVEPRIIIERN